MSAYIVDKETIDALVEAACSVLEHESGMRWWDCDAVTLRTDGDWSAHQREIRYFDSERQNEIGRMLWLENLASIESRYPDTIDNHEYPGPCDFEGAETVAEYRFRASFPTESDALKVLRLIDSYEYQTCEHDDWPSSEAASFCDALRRKMIHRLYAQAAARVVTKTAAVRCPECGHGRRCHQPLIVINGVTIEGWCPYCDCPCLSQEAITERLKAGDSWWSRGRNDEERRAAHAPLTLEQ